MGEKWNILFTIPNFKTAGSQFVLLELYKRIDRSLFKPYILVEKFPTLFPEEVKEKERLFITENTGKRSYIWQLAKLLKEKQIDLVHSWDYKSNSIEALACKKAGVKYVYTKKNNAWSKRWFAKSLLSSYVAYNNPEMKARFFSHLFLKNNVTCIPHGVATKIFMPLSVKKDSDTFSIGCIGVIGENKNQLLLLEALTILPKNIQVYFYGKEDEVYSAILDAYIREHRLEDRVTFKGFIHNTDIPKVMTQFDVLVLASKQEGLPLSIIEGMACGVPVLSSNSGGGARYLLKDDCGGFIFEDKNELVSQVLQFYNNPALKSVMGAQGRERVLVHFSIEKEVNAYKELYLSLVK